MKFVFLIITVLFVTASLIAQEETRPDSVLILSETLADSTTAKVILPDTSQSVSVKRKRLRNFFKKDYPNPKRAMLLSFVLPGAGQMYNKKYWKAPIAIGATVGMIFWVDYNTKAYRLFRDEYKIRFIDDPSIQPDPRLVNWTPEDLRTERDRWNKYKEMSYIGLILVQALGGVDAFVDAHMAGFEINEDLSMQVKPSFQSTPVYGSTLGLGVTFKITAPPLPQPKAFFSESH